MSALTRINGTRWRSCSQVWILIFTTLSVILICYNNFRIFCDTSSPWSTPPSALGLWNWCALDSCHKLSTVTWRQSRIKNFLKICLKILLKIFFRPRLEKYFKLCGPNCNDETMKLIEYIKNFFPTNLRDLLLEFLIQLWFSKLLKMKQKTLGEKFVNLLILK